MLRITVELFPHGSMNQGTKTTLLSLDVVNTLKKDKKENYEYRCDGFYTEFDSMNQTSIHVNFKHNRKNNILYLLKILIKEIIQ